MIGQVVTNPEDGDVGRFLRLVQNGRYDGRHDVSDEWQDFEMVDKAEITLKEETSKKFNENT